MVIFADSPYAIAIAKGRAMEAEIRKGSGCSVLAFEGTPLSDVSTRIPQLTTLLRSVLNAMSSTAPAPQPASRPSAWRARFPGRRGRR